jgi:NAD+ diphosphatase
MYIPFSRPPQFTTANIAPETQERDAIWFVVQGAQLLVHVENEAARLPLARRIEELNLAPMRSLYLGTLGDTPCYSIEVNSESQSPSNSQWQGLRSLYGRLDDELFALAGRAVQLIDWDRSHQFCGRCGTPTEHKMNERARQCPVCQLTAYPRIAPAVMCLVKRTNKLLRRGELLLARSPHFMKGMYSALAGFVEPGESLEECLAREVQEEVGVEVTNLRYFASQPWPFPHSLMIAFTADYARGELTPEPGEIEDCGWFDIDALPGLPGKISIARRLIDATLAEMRQRK